MLGLNLLNIFPQNVMNNNALSNISNSVKELENSIINKEDDKIILKTISNINQFLMNSSTINIFVTNPSFLKLYILLFQILQERKSEELILDSLIGIQNLYDINPQLIWQNVNNINISDIFLNVYSSNKLKIKEQIIKILSLMTQKKKHQIKSDKLFYSIISDYTIFNDNNLKNSILYICLNICKPENNFEINSLNKSNIHEIYSIFMNLLKEYKSVLSNIEIICLLILNFSNSKNLNLTNELFVYFIENNFINELLDLLKQYKDNSKILDYISNILKNFVNKSKEIGNFLNISNILEIIDDKFSPQYILLLDEIIKKDIELNKEKINNIIHNILLKNKNLIINELTLKSLFILLKDLFSKKIFICIEPEDILNMIKSLINIKSNETRLNIVKNLTDIFPKILEGNPKEIINILYKEGILEKIKENKEFEGIFKFIINYGEIYTNIINKENDLKKISFDENTLTNLVKMTTYEIEKSNIIEKILNYFNLSKNNICKNHINVFNNLKIYFNEEEKLIHFYKNIISLLSLYKEELLDYLLNNIDKKSGATIKIIYNPKIFESLDKDELENLGEFSEELIKFHKRFLSIKEYIFDFTVSNNFNFYDYINKMINEHSHLKINNNDENPFYIKYKIYYKGKNDEIKEIDNLNEKQKLLLLLLENKEIYFGITYDLKDENYIDLNINNEIDDKEFFCEFINNNERLVYEKEEDIMKNNFLRIYQKLLIKKIECKSKNLSDILFLLSVIRLFYIINFKNKRKDNLICQNLDEIIQSFMQNEKNQFFFTKLIDYTLFSFTQNYYLNHIFSFDTRYNLFKLKFDARRTFINYFDYIKSNKNLNSNLTNQRYKIQIERGKEFEDFIKIFEKNLDKNTFTTIFNYNGYIEFDFNNEIGKGIGPTNEFYSNLFHSFMERNLKYFIINKDNFLYPLPKFSDKKNKKEILLNFSFLGFIIARCILDDRLIDIPLSKTFIDLVTEKTINLNDIQNIHKEIYDFISKKDYIEDIKSLNLYFIFPNKENDIELIKNGKNILITNENINEYIINLYNFLFESKEIKEIINSFKEGFNNVFPIERLNYLSSEEIQNIILTSEIENWEEKEISKFINIEHGYTIESIQIKYFFKYLSELNKENKKKFLKFITGSERLPFLGFEGLKPRLTIVKRITEEYNNPDYFLPSVMTCQNYLKIPEYSSYEIFKQKMDFAILEGGNEFNLS